MTLPRRCKNCIRKTAPRVLRERTKRIPPMKINHQSTYGKYSITQAEKQFGGGTGKLKLAAVSDWIYQRIPAVLKLLFSERDIENMIESVLEEAKKAWGNNENLKEYVETPPIESLLTGYAVEEIPAADPKPEN